MARKKGMQFIPYDYEAAYNKSLEEMHEWFIENLFQHRKKVVYALKEITAGDQFEIEIYPQFRSMDEVPPEGRTIKKDNNKAQKNLNDKNARKYVERLINENFSDRDIWMTLTYDDAHLPPDGDVDAAIKNVQKYIRRINYQRKKRGLPNAKYVYVTAYNPDAEIRWHHHIVMDGALDMETVESCWKQSSRNEVRRLQTDENGLSGMANYIVEEKNRVPSEKRWNSSQGLRDPRIKVVHSKRPAAGGSYKKIGSFVDKMVKDRDSIPEILKKWYPDMDFTNAAVYYNDFNCMFIYMHDCGKGGRQVKRRIRRALKRAGLYNAFHITVIAVLLTGFCVTLFNVKEPEQQEEETETTQAEVMQNPETMTQTAESIEDKYKVFDTMSEDWGSDDLEGFVFYDLPEQYADKGYFPEKMQIYTRSLCKQNDVPYALVLAIIEYESGYEFDKTGDNGNSKGYMQIYEKWHTDRMQKLNCTDLMNPYQNVRVGIDFLSYLLKKYGTIQDTLAAYNYGEKGAREHLWSNGVYVYSYNTAIMQRMKEIEEVVGK